MDGSQGALHTVHDNCQQRNSIGDDGERGGGINDHFGVIMIKSAVSSSGVALRFLEMVRGAFSFDAGTTLGAAAILAVVFAFRTVRLAGEDVSWRSRVFFATSAANSSAFFLWYNGSKASIIDLKAGGMEFLAFFLNSL